MQNTLLLAVAVMGLFICPASAADTKRSNVLFLISDDLNSLLGCYGDALFPPSGQIPKIQPGFWAPNLTDP